MVAVTPARALVAATLVVLAALAVTGPLRPAEGQGTVTRLDAATAVEAGLLVSQRVFADGATRHVVLVRDDTFADALVAGPLAGELPGLAPILFTPTDRLDPDVAGEIARVTGGGGVVHIVGGTGAVGQSVEDALVAAGHDVQRLAGPTRLDTALAVFDTFFADDLAGGDVMIARAFGSGADQADAWPDAVAGGGYGAARGVPILLTPSDAIPAVVLDRIIDAEVGAALVLGGQAAVGGAVETALGEVVAEVRRVAGEVRESTAVAVATDLFGIPALQARDTAVLVNGRSSFAFGLAAATLSAAGSGAGEAPVLLVTADSPTACGAAGEAAAATGCYLAADGTQPGEIILVGDTAQISAEVAQAVAELRNGGQDS